MKKLLCLLLSAAAVLSMGISALAAPDPSALRGDLNCDGKVTPAEARQILRFAAKLDAPTDDERIISDIDSSGNINAADARIALRIAAKLDTNWTIGEEYHAHDYKLISSTPATCTTAGSAQYKCAYCDAGYTKTLPAAHKYAAATCTAPQTCTLCGKTNGSALGHSTTLGRCSRCDILIDTDLDFMISVVEHYLNGDNYIEALNYYTYYGDITNAKKSVASLRSEYQTAYNMLHAKGNYKELENLTSKAIGALNKMYNANLNTNSGIDTWNTAISDFDYQVERIAEQLNYLLIDFDL